MFIKFLVIFVSVSAIAIFGDERPVFPIVSKELPLYEFGKLVNVSSHPTYHCSDKKDGKFSCFSTSNRLDRMLTVDIDGEDYFFGIYYDNGDNTLTLSYYTGNINIWSSYNGRKDLAKKGPVRGSLLWKNKHGEEVTYKIISKDRIPASL